MATIKEIAKEAGTSPSTVSIILGGKAEQRKISQATQEKVLEAAARLGYKPNIAARSLRDGSKNDELVIAMFWAQDFRASMMIRFMDGLRKAMTECGHKIRLVTYPYQNDHMEEETSLNSTADFHAAIICNASYQDLAFLEDNSLPIPVVLYNRICNGYSSVNVDDFEMGRMAAEAFVQAGCTDATVLTGPPAFIGMENRVHGFRNTCEQLGLTVNIERYCENSIAGGYRAFLRSYQKKKKASLPSAVFCGSAAIAHGVFRACYDTGLTAADVPKTIAIGNGAEDNDSYSIPSLSVINVPMEEMAAECLDLALGLINGEITEPQQRMLAVEYIKRESC